MKYVVDHLYSEISELADVVSITWRVNGRECAAKLRLSKVAGLSSEEQKREKQKALIAAYESEIPVPSAEQGEVVEV